MTIKNTKLTDYKFLVDMYKDAYFPDFLVDKVRDILSALCEKIESKTPENDAALLELTHAATECINDLQEAFYENDSELETGARESIAADFEYIVRAYGFHDISIEDVIATRDW